MLCKMIVNVLNTIKWCELNQIEKHFTSFPKEQFFCILVIYLVYLLFYI